MAHLDRHADVDAVRDATDLVALIGEHVALTPRGREFVGLCPFHDDSRPSFAVVTHKGNAFYKCHACGAAGDAFTFVQEFHRRTFPEALELLAERAGITLSRRGDASKAAGESGTDRKSLRSAVAHAERYFRSLLAQPEGAAARTILHERGITDDAIESFGLGLAPEGWDTLRTLIQTRRWPIEPFVASGLLKRRQSGDGLYDTFRHRLIFPIRDELGQPLAFGGRRIDPDEEPKYLNSPESSIFHKSQVLYGLDLARRAIIATRQVIVTEGYTDVIACHQAGVTNVVATLGTALTADHARVLKRLCDTVVLLFDGDEAGQRAADRAIEVFFAEPVDISICVLPEGQDPDEILKGDGGADRFRALIGDAVDALTYKIRQFQHRIEDVEGLAARQTALETFLGDLGRLGFSRLAGVRKRLVMQQIASTLGVTVQDVQESMPATPARPVSRVEPRPSADETPPTSLLEPRDANEGPVPRNRRLAEAEFLGLLLATPALAKHPIPRPDGDPVAAADVLGPEDFADVTLHAIASELLPRLREGRPTRVQDLLDALDRPDARALVPQLYMEAEPDETGGLESEASVRLERAAAALLAIVNRNQYEKTLQTYRRRAPEGTDAQQSTLELIEARRRHGDHPGAFPLGVR